MDRAFAQLEPFLSDAHSKLLEWFFGPGAWTFGRSTCGAIIDRLQMYSFGSDPCEVCKGTGFRGGWSYGDEAALKLTKVEELAALIGVYEPAARKRWEDGDPDGSCLPCRGTGWHARVTRRRVIGQITVRPKASDSHGMGYTPGDYALQHYAIACRRLDIVSAADPRAAAVLEAFYGDWGARWADTVEGRLFAIYPFTAAGHKLMRMSAEKAKLEDCELRPDELLGVEFALQRQKPNRRRGDLFTAARDQAKRVLGEACQAWNASESEVRRARVAQRELEEKTKRDSRIREILSQQNDADEQWEDAAAVEEEIAS